MTPKEFEKICKTGDPRGCFLLYGEEEGRKSECLRALRSATFPDGDDPFNRVVLTPDDDLLTALSEQIAGLPMFADKKLAEVHSVNYLKASRSFLEELALILGELPRHEECVVVLYAENNEFSEFKSGKKKTDAFEILSPVVQPVAFTKVLRGELRERLRASFSENGVSIAPPTVDALIEHCSDDLLALSSEADKLICYTLASGKNAVDAADIPVVCCGKRVFGAYDFADALMAGDAKKACRILKKLKDRREPAPSIVGSVIDLLGNMLTVRTMIDDGMNKAEIIRATGLHEYPAEKYMAAVRNRRAARLKKALAVCLDADLQIKSSPLDDEIILDKLIVRMSRV